ncbi:MAG: Fe(2+)-trafficking protein [Planctomycetota bacterium]
MDPHQRIAQFEDFCREDPDNDMAWFSLAGAYREAGRHGSAADAYQRCFEANPNMTKAYQLAGDSLIEAGREDEAAEILTKGFVIADERGDRMPMNAMGELLDRLGKPRPVIAKPEEAAPPSTGDWICPQTGLPANKMARPPFRGALGEWIQSNVSDETFKAWLVMGTNTINTFRLDLSNDDDAAMYDYVMYRFFGLEPVAYAELSGSAFPSVPAAKLAPLMGQAIPQWRQRYPDIDGSPLDLRLKAMEEEIGGV